MPNLPSELTLYRFTGTDCVCGELKFKTRNCACKFSERKYQQWPAEWCDGEIRAPDSHEKLEFTVVESDRTPWPSNLLDIYCSITGDEESLSKRFEWRMANELKSQLVDLHDCSEVLNPVVPKTQIRIGEELEMIIIIGHSLSKSRWCLRTEWRAIERNKRSQATNPNSISKQQSMLIAIQIRHLLSLEWEQKEQSTRVTAGTKNTQKRVGTGWDGRRSTRDPMGRAAAAGQRVDNHKADGQWRQPKKYVDWLTDKETMGREKAGGRPGKIVGRREVGLTREPLTTSYEKR
ncbi:hypothetical protein BY996DRAFT_6551230 [Phakopsora pachyrhizi]|nr:hypothetical protein BY996DRAFT_6551230 [Phakopsora pachyrhizi]